MTLSIVPNLLTYLNLSPQNIVGLGAAALDPAQATTPTPTTSGSNPSHDQSQVPSRDTETSQRV